MSSYWADVYTNALLFAILAVALNLLIGYAGYLSLAHAAFFGIGAYAAGIAEIHWESGFLVSTLFAIAVTAVAGAALAFPAVRVSGEHVVLLTLAFLMVVNQVEVAWIDVTGGATGLFPISGISLGGHDFFLPEQFIYVAIVAAALVLAFCLVIGRSPFGRVLKAIREDQRAARALGKNVIGASVAVFAVSTGIAGFAGSLWAHYYSFITPQSFDINQTITIAAMVVLGGIASLWGSVLGAIALVVLSAYLSQLQVAENDTAAIQQIIYGVALILFMFFRPTGLIDGSKVRRPLRRSARAGGPADVAPDSITHVRKDVGRRGEPAVVVRDVTKSYSGLVALDGVDMVLPAGEITILVGANGAGKTTLFNVLTGDTQPDSGSVELNGRSLVGLRSNRVVARGMARSFQDVRLFQQLSALDNVMLGVQGNTGERLRDVLLRPLGSAASERRSRERAMACLRAVGLADEPSRVAGDLSYGEQKLLAIARLIATDCDVLLLDEPTSGVDPVWVDRILELITGLADQGYTICLVEHSLEVVSRLPATAYFLQAGRIVSRGTLQELMSQKELVDAYFGA